ncbi:cytochrome C oxidase assembly factor 3b [Pholidichthys leucotaenia]
MAQRRAGGEGRPAASEEQLQPHDWHKRAARLRSRNRKTGLAIGAFVVAIFGYTIFSVKQEKIVEEVNEEARINIIRGPRTGANS